MNDRAEASSVLRESLVTVFVNSVAGGGRARACLSPIQKLFESSRVNVQFVMTNCPKELEASAQGHFARAACAICHGWGWNISDAGECSLRSRRSLGRPPHRRRE